MNVDARRTSEMFIKHRRDVSSAVLILISAACALAALAEALGLSLSFHLGRVRLRSADPIRPLIGAVLFGWWSVAMAGGRTRDLVRWFSAITSVAIVALVFALSTALQHAFGDAAFL